jgi:dihydropteroate synthase
MGIVNVTPGLLLGRGPACAVPPVRCAIASSCCKDGADILDIGGESTRPGSPPCRWKRNCARVLPVVRVRCAGCAVSVDTYKPRGDAGGARPGRRHHQRHLGFAPAGRAGGRGAHPRCGVCLMHMHRDPQTMQAAPMQGDVVPQVRRFLQAVGRGTAGAGRQPTRIVLDPGIGFGKTVAQNFSCWRARRELLARLPGAGGLVAQVFAGGCRQTARWRRLGCGRACAHGAQRGCGAAGGGARRAHRAGA